MNILPSSSRERHHDRPSLRIRKSKSANEKPWCRRSRSQGRPLYSTCIAGVVEQNGFDVSSIPTAACCNLHCHCRSLEMIYCASWPGNQENCDLTLVSVTVQPRQKPPSSPYSLSRKLQTILRRTHPRQRAPPRPCSENLPQENTAGNADLSYGDMFLRLNASRKLTDDGGRISEKTASTDTTRTPKSDAGTSIQFRRPSLYGSGHYLIDVTNGSQAPETYVADVLPEKVGIARVTPPDSQSPSPPKNAATLHQPRPLPSYYNASPEKENQQVAPSPEALSQQGDCIPSTEMNAKSHEAEGVLKEATAPKVSRPPLYRNNSQDQRTQSDPKITFRLGKNRAKPPAGSTAHDEPRARAGAPPPILSPHITIASLLNDGHGSGGIPSDLPPGFDDFTVEQPSYEYQPTYWGESSKPNVYKRPLVALLWEEEPEAYHEPPRPVQKVPLELQWQGDNETGYIPPLFPLDVPQPKKLDKGKSCAPQLLLSEEVGASVELYAGGKHADPIDFSDFTFDDDEDAERGPPPSPRPKPRSLCTLRPKPTFQDQEDDADALARGPPPTPRPGQVTLKRPLSPPLNQEQVHALRFFNLSNPARSIFSPPDDSDVLDIDTDTESIFELKNSKKLRLKHVVDRAKLLTETIAYYYQTPEGDPHTSIYTNLSPWEKEQALLLYDQTDVVPYMERYSHVQTWDEEEDDAPYIHNACSGTIPASIKNDYKVAHFADEHLFRRCNRTGELVWRGEKVYFVRDWHPYHTRYAVLQPRMYTAFERRLDEEKMRQDDLKDNEGFRAPPPPRRRLSRARGATPGVGQSLVSWLRTTEFSLTEHDRMRSRQEEMKREIVRVRKTEMSFTDADKRRRMQGRLKIKVVRGAAGGLASGDGIGPLRQGPSRFVAPLQRARTAADGPAPETPREETKGPPFRISPVGISDILRRRAAQRKCSPPLAPGSDSNSLRGAILASGPRGWKTKEQAREEAERLAAEQRETLPQPSQDTPIPSIEETEEAIDGRDLEDNALRGSPFLPARGSPFNDRAGQGVTVERNQSQPPALPRPPSLDILDVYRRVHGIPARRYSSGGLPAPRNGQRLHPVGSRVSRLDALPDVMFLPEWEPRHFQHYVETNKHSKVPKIVQTLAQETEEYNFDADDLDDEDIDDIFDGEYDDEQAAGDDELRLRYTTSEESREDEEGDDTDAWRASVPASCLRESVEPEGRELFSDGQQVRHEELRTEWVTVSPLNPDFGLSVYRFENELLEREYVPHLQAPKQWGQGRNFESSPFRIHNPLSSAQLCPHRDEERLREIEREQAEAEVSRIVCTMPTPEREVRDGVVDDEYEVKGPEDGAWPTIVDEEGKKWRDGME